MKDALIIGGIAAAAAVAYVLMKKRATNAAVDSGVSVAQLQRKGFFTVG